VNLTQRALEALDLWADEEGVDRGRAAEALIMVGLDATEEAEPDVLTDEEGQEIPPEDVLFDFEGNPFLIDRERSHKDGSMTVKLLPLELEDVDDGQSDDQGQDDDASPTDDEGQDSSDQDEEAG
jgi:hypothetical protein